MFGQTTSWRQSAAPRRNVLSLLAVLWLNMAVLPCAMAFESDEICPHCPPDGHEMASHHGHGAAHAEPSSATIQSECCDLEEISVDARSGKVEVKPASEVIFITGPAVAEVPTQALRQPQRALDPPDVSGSSPPLHVLFCVYLD